MPGLLRIAIVGYGTGGQAAAVLLSRDGHRVEVFERAPQLGPVGAGFLLQPVGQAVLWSMGLLDAALAHGARIDSLYGETHAGRPVMDMRYAELDARLSGLGLQRGALFQLLDAAWTEHRVLHCGSRIVDVDTERGALVDADGRRHAGFDLVVVADGAGSSLRTRVSTPTIDRPNAWGAQWCLAPMHDWASPHVLKQRYVRARRMAGMLPVGTRPDDPVPRLSFFWSVPADELDRVDVDAAQWRRDVAEVWPDALARLDGIDAPSALAQARYRDTVHRTWHRGRTVLLGDSAHAMSPQLGQGVNMALLDAQGLRDALRAQTNVASALQRYQHERRAHLAAYHFWSRALTPLFQSHRDAAARVRDLTFHPLSRLPIARGMMLRVLTGTRRGWLSTHALPAGFVDALPHRASTAPALEAAI
ncbi:FAD-dependent oxidoreductase [Lysobacter claricitrinus]|uniref:FAD-dependent oxidoreductase n=1 Tax=Lysobacter claricitrinus TaxID=3367728 RepID=UPI0037DBEB79